MNEILFNTPHAPAPVPVRTIDEHTGARFIEFLDASPKTIQTYTRALRQFFRFLAETERTTHPERADIVAYRDALKATGHKPGTVQSYITAVRLFFQWTEAEGLYPNIAEHIKGAKLDRDHKKDYLAADAVKKVLGAMDTRTETGKRDYAIVALMITGGLRTVEVSRANIEDLQTAAGAPVLFVQGKGHEDRAEYVKLPAQTEAAIRAYLKARGATDPKQPLFASASNNSQGERISTRSVSAIAKAAMQRAGYDSERLTAHSLRHTAVTLSLLAGESLEEVQQFARHKNIETTMIYNHALDRAKNNCAAAIAAAIF